MPVLRLSRLVLCTAISILLLIAVLWATATLKTTDTTLRLKLGYQW